MKAIEKVKTQKLIAKFESGNFDENDVDNLFMKLRAYSHGNRIFREIADFVAHNDERNQGVANESLEAFYLSIRFFLEYVSTKKALDVSSHFPLYIKKLMKYQVDKCKESDLKSKFRLNKQRLKFKIDSFFSEDKKQGIAYLKKPKISEELLRAIQYLLSFIGSQPAFDQDELLAEVLKVIKVNKLNVNESEFLRQSDRLALCVMLLLHDATFEYGGYRKGFCKISCEKTSISYNQNFIDTEGNPVEHNESFGSLQVIGHVILEKDGKDLTVCYPLMSTNLSAKEWCDENMFCIESLIESHPSYLFLKINFDKNLYFTEEGKIGVLYA